MIDLEPTHDVDAAPKRSMWLTVLMVLVLLASTAGVTYLLMIGPAGDKVASGASDVVGEEPTQIAAQVEAPSFVSTDEPIADAAEVILPSVVQILTSDGGLGSGVIYDSAGLILTAAHVIEGESEVTVRFADGEEVMGTVIGGAAEADVGVVQVDRAGLPAAQLALGETPRVGQLAIAVGSPWGLQSTVTAGIVSATNQAINCTPNGPCQSLLQTDAAINPGNSGGALVDRFGRLIGINVSIFTLSGASEGVGFAVPIDVAYDVADRLVSGESLETANLGVRGSDVESGQAGAVISEVFPGTGAAEAGIEPGDLVISIDGVTVQGIADLASQVRTHRPGSTVEIVVVRDGAEITYEVTLGEFPDS